MIHSDLVYKQMLGEIEDYAILLLDNDGTILNWNAGAEKIKGYTAEEITGKNFRLFYTQEDRDKKLPEKLIQEAITNRRAVDEGWRVRKDGVRFWGSVLITAIHDKDDKVIGFTKITRDLTEKKNAEELGKNLEQTKENLLKIFNASPSGMLLIDTESHKITEVNKSFTTTLGYSREESIGKSATELGYVTGETQQKSFGKFIEQGYLRNEDILCISKEGKRIDAIFSVEPFEMENMPHMLVVLNDISNIRKMERRLIESENKYRTIIEEAGDVLYSTDAHGTFTYVNKRATTLTEYSESELLNKHFTMLIAPEWHAKVRASYLEQFHQKKHENIMEFVIITKTGQKKWVEQVVVMQTEAGNIKGLQCIVRDITERKKDALLLAEQKDIIEQKNKDILDSINYAKRIQDAIFPPQELIKELLPKSFILFKPKDIISGDFYWIEKFDTRTYVAAVDCTGHGVPGALLSVVGYNLLSKSINEHEHIKPSEILNELSNGINKTLRQKSNEDEIHDTMDIALCSIDRVTNMLEFAGAYNSLYLIRNNQLIEIPADRFPIGVLLDGKPEKFTNHEMQLEKGDIIYLFSDGYADQFGGPKEKKLKSSGFKDVLLSVHHLPINAQKKALDKALEEWKWMTTEQTDDILVIGIGI